tara:strand:- start:8872 stop:9141 length:270 start_codon:yes stop_codon:yes gene_type:complete
MGIDEYIAYKLDDRYIYYKCKYCYRIKHKIIGNPITTNGNKYKGLMHGFHIYNSYGDFTNRILDLKSHCLFSPNKSIKLVINQKTLKIK